MYDLHNIPPTMNGGNQLLNNSVCKHGLPKNKNMRYFTLSLGQHEEKNHRNYNSKHSLYSIIQRKGNVLTRNIGILYHNFLLEQPQEYIFNWGCWKICSEKLTLVQLPLLYPPLVTAEWQSNHIQKKRKNCFRWRNIDIL